MKTRKCLFFFVSVLFTCCFVASCLAMTMNPAKNLTTDQSALLVLKAHITSDPHSVLKYNWSISYPVCNWVGIICDARHRRVTALNLSFMGLEGTIPSNLGNLSFLKYLEARDNNFHGHLPNELGKLHRLKVLNFNNNNISGGIQTWIGVLSKLRFLHLSDNRLNGTIPDSLFNLSKLEILELSDNIVTGNISTEIGKLSNLKRINLRNNQLSGSIPSTIFNISTLQMIDLNSNSLSGSLPDDLCSHLPKLEILRLSQNKLFGQLSARLGNCSELRNLSLSYNKFIGSIPENIGNLRKLRYLFLNTNNLKGLIPSTIFNISSLKGISMANNSLFGKIPMDMCRGLPVIEILSLGRNNISGSIPKNVNNCTLLNDLDLYENRLTDIIERLNIMTDVALALEYLHHGQSAGAVVHCDLKPSNILLDENMVAHVSDFGISKLLGEGDSMTKTLTMATIGYMAPEYGSEGIVSSRSDVYSYGVLLMETFTRKKPTDEIFEGEMSLKNWVKDSFPYGLTEVVDANLLQEERGFTIKMDCILSIMNLALDCTMDSPEQRISMIDAAAKLKKIKMRFVKDVGKTA